MTNEHLLRLTAKIAASYTGSNKLPAAELPALIESTYAALEGLGKVPAKPPAPIPAVPIKKSVTPDALISLENGKPYRTLKRHLQSAYGMTPHEYRAKWGLPEDYPMVAPNYAARRSELARSIGLGRAHGFVNPGSKRKRPARRS